jgi:hypothetical protein
MRNQDTPDVAHVFIQLFESFFDGLWADACIDQNDLIIFFDIITIATTSAGKTAKNHIVNACFGVKFAKVMNACVIVDVFLLQFYDKNIFIIR